MIARVSEAVLAQLAGQVPPGLASVAAIPAVLQGLLQGDLGASFRYADWSVNDLVASALPVSLSIGGIAMLLSALIGVALGIGAALRQNSAVDYLVMMLGNLGSAVPSFVMGPVLIIIFAIAFKWLPAGAGMHLTHASWYCPLPCSPSSTWPPLAV